VCRLAVTSLAALASALAAVVFAAPSFGASAPPRRDQPLSNARTFARWAHITQAARIFRTPSTQGRRVGRLRFNTEDGLPETYLLLVRHVDSAGQGWVKLRIPGRPNGRVGWVRREALGPFHFTDKRIVVDRARLRMYVLRRGRLRWSAPVGIGKRGTPTPAGRFWIREKIRIWSRRSGYWPYAFGTAAYSTLSEWPGGGVVGIHGPYGAPWWAIPGRISHGCIRLRPRDVSWLARHIGVGTPLRIR
jgi:L,D-transpeptidase catalytic domain